MIQAVFFDLDGTLMDTAFDITRAINHALKAHELEPITLEALRPIISYGSAAVLQNLCNIHPNNPNFKSIVASVLSHYPSIMSENTEAFSGFDTVLDSLDMNQIPWGVISNKPENLVQDLLHAKSLLHRSVVAYGAETFEKKKPDPMPLIEAARYLNMPTANCIYVGDCKNDIIAAKAAGMQSAVAEFGYVPEDGSQKDWQADHYFKKPESLLELL